MKRAMLLLRKINGSPISAAVALRPTGARKWSSINSFETWEWKSGSIGVSVGAGLRQLIRITVNELFEIVESKDIRLKDDHIRAITKFLLRSFGDSAKQVQNELAGLDGLLGLPIHANRAIEMQFDTVLHQEAVAEVSIRASALQRKQDAKRMKRWSEHIEQLVLLVVGAALGVLGTLATLWLTK